MTTIRYYLNAMFVHFTVSLEKEIAYSLQIVCPLQQFLIEGYLKMYFTLP